jgi:4'-phosphopantetheinyl transferase
LKLPRDYSPPPLKRGAVHLWSYEISSAAEYTQKLLPALSAGEREKAERFYREKDRVRSLTVYALLRDILSVYSGIKADTIEISLSDKGKPYMEGENAPVFNLSHSGDRVLFAFTGDEAVGVDIEEEKELRDLNGLVKECCSPEEADMINNIDQKEATALFYRFWTAKEAYLKGIGTGISVALNSLDLSSSSRIGLWSITPCNFWRGYSATVALPSDDPKIIIITS